MGISLRKDLEEIKNSFEIMKLGLHWWDAVDNQIDQELKEIKTVLSQPSIDPQIVESFRQDRERLWKLTDQERSDDIDTAEKTLIGLKITAVAGLAVPTAYFLWGAAGLWMALGEGSLSLEEIAALTGTGALADGMFGGAANIFGQGIGKLIYWDSRSSFSDWSEMTASHLKWGAIAASAGVGKATGLGSLQIKNLKWALGIPVAVSSTAVGSILVANQMQTASNPSHDITNSSDKFLAKLHQFMEDGIDAEESKKLWEMVQQSHDPLIQHDYTQINAPAFNEALIGSVGDRVFNPMTMEVDTRYARGNIVRFYRGSAENLCLHFGKAGEKVSLPCDVNSNDLFQHSGLEAETVNAIPMAWKDDDLHVQYAKEAMKLAANQHWVAADEGIKWIAEHVGDVSFVEEILPKIYEDLLLPESACLVTHMLLNIFMVSDQISADVKQYYLGLIDRNIRRWGNRLDLRLTQMREKMAMGEGRILRIEGKLYTMDPVADPQQLDPILERLQTQGDHLKKSWDYFGRWMKDHLSKEVYADYEPRWKKLSEKLETVYHLSWDHLRTRLFDKQFVQGYAASVTQAYGAMVGPYVASVQSPYDFFASQMVDPATHRPKFLNGGIVDLGFLGWFGSGFFLKSFQGWPAYGVKSAWAASTVLAADATMALLQYHSPTEPLQLHLPTLTGLASQEYQLQFDERLEEGAQEAAKEMEEMRKKAQ